MKIAVGSDHAGFDAKMKLIASLKRAGHAVTDAGTDSTESVDYPDFAGSVGRMVADKEVDRGVLVCGTGIGMCMAANKVPGVRAALAMDEFMAEMGRKHNNANILCLGARLLSVEKMENLLRIFMATAFEGGRHEARVEKINRLGSPVSEDSEEE